MRSEELHYYDAILSARMTRADGPEMSAYQMSRIRMRIGKIKTMQEEKVILVNDKDEALGLMSKLEAHQKGLLHRAFSVFILNDKGDLMLQQRAARKYHSPGLWTNTCCSHHREGESNIEAGQRRLREEMGFVTKLTELFSFIYKAPFDNGLTEHEFDHVLLGKYNDAPLVNPDEVAGWKWMSPEAVKQDMENKPELYTVWFKIIFNRFYHHITQHTP